MKQNPFLSLISKNKQPWSETRVFLGDDSVVSVSSAVKPAVDETQ